MVNQFSSRVAGYPLDGFSTSTKAAFVSMLLVASKRHFAQ